MWSYFLEGLSPERMVETFAGHGWRHLELSSEHGWDLLGRGDAARAGTAFRSHAGKHGVAFPQAHFDLGADIAQPAGSEERRKVLDNLKRWCDLFAALGVNRSPSFSQA